MTKRAQHIAPNDVAICCVQMLDRFAGALVAEGKKTSGPAGAVTEIIQSFDSLFSSQRAQKILFQFVLTTFYCLFINIVRMLVIN